MASEEMQATINFVKEMLEQGFGARFDESLDPVKLRNAVEPAQAAMPLEEGVTLKEETLGGIYAELAVPEGARDDALLIYIHGGGLVCGNAMTSRGYTSMLAIESKIPTYAFSYRLAPENPYPAPLDDCVAVYEAILKKHPGKSLFLIGESGGALLCVASALRIRDMGLEMPAGIIPYSVVMDFSNTIDRIRPETDDFNITPEGLNTLGRLYCPDESKRKDPYCSPYFADLTGLPPALLGWDKAELLAADNEYLVQKLKEAGIEVRYKAYEGCFHAFSTTGTGTPESYELLKDTIAFVNDHIK